MADTSGFAPETGLAAEAAATLQDPVPSNARTARLLRSAGKATRIIEIGPGYNPVAPKAAGWNTHVVDHTSREGLQAKYSEAGMDLNVVEEVDFIWQSGPLHEAVPARLRGSFDLLIASHLIEHVPDFIRFFTSAGQLLAPDGMMSLAVPDRRYCFDYFQSPTMTGDLLEAYAAQRSRHSIRTAWNSFAYRVTLDGGLATGQLPVRDIAFLDAWTQKAAAWERFRDDPDKPYEDHHCWYFTPAGFSLVILELGQMGLIDWRIDSMHGPEGFEFFATLRRGAERFDDMELLQNRRMTLLRTALEEARQQTEPAIAGNPGATPAPGTASAADAAADSGDRRQHPMGSLRRSARRAAAIMRARTNRSPREG